jgi:hypothetical protein
MRFLPYENLTYHSPLSEAETIQNLSTLIRSGQYSGTVNRQSFTIQRVIRYRNSFLPQIKGTVQSDFGGTVITIKMRLNLLVLIFLGIWIGGVIFVPLGTFIASDKSGTAIPLIPLGMLFFAYLLTVLAFKFESNKAKKDLQQLWKAALREPA